MPNLIELQQKTQQAVDSARRRRNEEDRKFIIASVGKDLANIVLQILKPLLVSLTNSARITRDEMKQIISEIKVEIPKIDVPKAEVNVKIPEIKVPEAKVKVDIPEIKIPQIKVPRPEVKVNIPKQPQQKIDTKEIVDAISTMRFPEEMKLRGLDRGNPMPVLMVGIDGNPVSFMGGGGGRVSFPKRPPTQSAIIDTASSGDNTIVSAVSNKRIKVLSYFIVTGGAVDCRWKSGSSTNLSGAMPFVANTGIASGEGDKQSDSPLLYTAIGEALVLNLSDAVQVSGHVSYYLEE